MSSPAQALLPSLHFSNYIANLASVICVRSKITPQNLTEAIITWIGVSLKTLVDLVPLSVVTFAALRGKVSTGRIPGVRPPCEH